MVISAAPQDYETLRRVIDQHGKIARRTQCLIENPVVQRPDRGLRPVVRTDLSENGLHMSLYGWLRDLEETCDMFVRISPNNAFKNRDLPRGQFHGHGFVCHLPWNLVCKRG